jgi:D-3-phosphoglycerate dehydrogenase
MSTLTLNPPPYIIIDFDSTFTKVEGLDELAAIALKGHPEKDQIVQKISDLTNKGMNGEMSFADGLRQRIALLKANRTHIDELVSFLRTKISDSFQRNKQFLTENAEQIFIVSSGFKEFIVPDSN